MHGHGPAAGVRRPRHRAPLFTAPARPVGRFEWSFGAAALACKYRSLPAAGSSAGCRRRLSCFGCPALGLVTRVLTRNSLALNLPRPPLPSQSLCCCQTGELFDYIVEKGRLGEDEARHFFQQIISGVE
jgi:hypothetical protein